MPAAGMSDTCATCHAPIRWVLTEAGRRMPIDFDPSPDGNVVARNVAGSIRAHILTGNELPAQETAYVPHHRTCPDAEQHKRRKRAATPKCRACGYRLDEWLVKRGKHHHVNCEPPDVREVAAEHQEVSGA